MRVGQRGKFKGHEYYEGCLEGGELFTVTELIEYFKEENNWLFRVKLDSGDEEILLSDQVEWLTEEDDLKTLQLLIVKYPDKMEGMQEEYIDELKSALKWMMDSYKATLGSKPVRNVDEIFAHAKHLLTR